MNHFANSIATINNAAKQKKESAQVRNTKLNRAYIKKLFILGFLKGMVFNGNKNKCNDGEISRNTLTKNIRVLLKFDNKNNSVIRNIYIISKPGKRVYIKYVDLKKKSKIWSKDNLNTTLISTSTAGIVTVKEALLLKSGGELLLNVF